MTVKEWLQRNIPITYIRYTPKAIRKIGDPLIKNRGKIRIGDPEKGRKTLRKRLEKLVGGFRI